MTQAEADVSDLGTMLKEHQQVSGERIVALEKKVASLESENCSLQQLLRISIDDTAKLKAEKEAAVRQLHDVQVCCVQTDW
jgi:hypothetical protein